jgi:hypothetical protein
LAKEQTALSDGAKRKNVFLMSAPAERERERETHSRAPCAASEALPSIVLTAAEQSNRNSSPKINLDYNICPMLSLHIKIQMLCNFQGFNNKKLALNNSRVKCSVKYLYIADFNKVAIKLNFNKKKLMLCNGR